MTIATTSTLSFRPITSHDASIFTKLSKKKKYRPLVGTGEKENRDMAYAYSGNRKDYPLAHLIQSKNGEIIGILILETAGKSGALEVNCVTEKISDYYTTLLKVVEICREENVPALYVSNIPGAPTDEYVKRTIETVHKTVKVSNTGTTETPEYEIVL